MSDRAIHDAFTDIVSRPPEAREAALAALEARAPGVAAEVRRMLPYYVEAPDDDSAVEIDHHDTPTDNQRDPIIHTFASGQFVERRTGAPRIPGHRIIEPLEHGGQSTVYLAEQSNPRRLVAIKVLRLAIMDPRARERFIAEAELQGTIRHPAIVGIHACDVVDADGRPLPWISMELVPGARSIRQAADDDGWDRRRRIEALATVAEAIHAAHLRGVVHRDLKPGNILIDRDGRVRIIDFGIARLLDAADGESLTREGELVGTIRYLAPEQLRGGSIDARADIHALGVLAFELLHDRSPWGRATSTSAILAAIERHEIAHPKARTRSDRDLNAVLARALAADPADRYESMAAFARDLRSLSLGNRVDARPATSLDEVRRFAARHPLPMGLSVMLMIAVIVGLVATGRYAADAQLQLDRGRVSRINAAIARGDLQAARRMVQEVPPHLRSFEHRLLANETEPTAISKRRAWESLRNLYEISTVPSAEDSLAIAAGGGSIAVLRLGADTLGGMSIVRTAEGDPPLGEVVRLMVDRHSDPSSLLLVVQTTSGAVGCLRVDARAPESTTSPELVIRPPSTGDPAVDVGVALADDALLIGDAQGGIDVHRILEDESGTRAVASTVERRIETGLRGIVTSIGMLSDGRMLVGTHDGRIARVGDDGRPPEMIDRLWNGIDRIVISPDERSFVACAARYLLCRRLDQPSSKLVEAQDLIWNASFSPTSEHVAVTGRDGWLRFLSTEDWDAIAEISETAGATWSSLWTENRLILATEREGVVAVSTDLIDSELGEHRILAISPSSRYLLRVDRGLWSIRDENDRTWVRYTASSVPGMHPDDVEAASIRDLRSPDDQDGLLAVVSVRERGLVGIDFDGRHHLLSNWKIPVREVRLASDGRRVLWRTEGRATHFGRLDESGRFRHDTIIIPPIRPQDEHGSPSHPIALFELGSDDLRVGTLDGRLIDPEGVAPPIVLHDPPSEQGDPPRRHAGWILSVASDPAGSLYIGNQNGEVSRWEDGRRVWTTESRRSKVIDLALHPDGTRLAALHSNGMIDILDTADGIVLCTLGRIPGAPACVHITADGRTLVAHAVDGRHRVWTQGDDARAFTVAPDAGDDRSGI